MKTIKYALAALILPAPLLAGSLTPPPVDPVIPAPAPAPVVALGGDWTGPYAGIQLGFGRGTDSAGGKDDGFVYGAHAGYDYDFGRFVLGAEVDADGASIDTGTAKVDSIVRAKLRTGVDLGRTLVYATGGAAHLNSDLGSDNGWTAGLGMAYAVTDNLSLGAEALTNRFDDVNGSGTDVRADTLTLRASFRF